MPALKRLKMNPNLKPLSKLPFAFDHGIERFELQESPGRLQESAGGACAPQVESKQDRLLPKKEQADPKLSLAQKDLDRSPTPLDLSSQDSLTLSPPQFFDSLTDVAHKLQAWVAHPKHERLTD